MYVCIYIYILLLIAHSLHVYGTFSFVGSKENMMLGATRIVNAFMPYAPRSFLQGPILRSYALMRTPRGPHGPAWPYRRALR